ncbi:hypothetical protein [Streptomyces sp. NPDC002644]
MTTIQSSAAAKAALRAGIIARQLDQIAPGTGRVTITPMTTEGRRRAWVTLEMADGTPVENADRDAHRAALGLLRRAFPFADRSLPYVYDAARGELLDATPATPAGLRLDTAPCEDDDMPDLVLISRPVRIETERAA